VSEFDVWKLEWAFTERMLKEDIRNNSAWNQRGWVLTHFLCQALQVHRPGAPREWPCIQNVPTNSHFVHWLRFIVIHTWPRSPVKCAVVSFDWLTSMHRASCRGIAGHNERSGGQGRHTATAPE
jgi:Protein prenyltransferase alpha subunit repeat